LSTLQDNTQHGQGGTAGRVAFNSIFDVSITPAEPRRYCLSRSKRRKSGIGIGITIGIAIGFDIAAGFSMDCDRDSDSDTDLKPVLPHCRI
jgi:hypothetical protein